MNIQCDHKECPANATHLIHTSFGEIVLCAHHFNDNIATIMEHGFDVYARALVSA